MALWCNWLTYCPVTAESTSSILVRVVKEVFLIKSKVNLDYNYSIPKMQDITELRDELFPEVGIAEKELIDFLMQNGWNKCNNNGVEYRKNGVTVTIK